MEEQTNKLKIAELMNATMNNLIDNIIDCLIEGITPMGINFSNKEYVQKSEVIDLIELVKETYRFK